MDLNKVIETAKVETIDDVIAYTVELTNEKYNIVSIYRSEQGDGFKLHKTNYSGSDYKGTDSLSKMIDKDVKANEGAIVSVSYNKGLAFDTWAENNKENK